MVVVAAGFAFVGLTAAATSHTTISTPTEEEEEERLYALKQEVNQELDQFIDELDAAITEVKARGIKEEESWASSSCCSCCCSVMNVVLVLMMNYILQKKRNNVFSVFKSKCYFDSAASCFAKVAKSQ